MSSDVVRIGIVGLGANTRLRHVPGLRACGGVEITAVCNRHPRSTAAAAAEFGIPKTYLTWQELVADRDIDAVVIGTWPYLHAPITVAALDSGKHVLTEARMARDAGEAHEMLEASRRYPELVTQVVPSPFGLRGDRVVRELLEAGFVGDLREVVVLGTTNALADSNTPLHWRQVRALSGVNMLTLGILHETLTRWIPEPDAVLAQARVFTPERRDPESGAMCPVQTPDSVRVLTEIPGGAVALYHLSGVTHFGPGSQIHFYGDQGTLKYLLVPEDRILGARASDSGLREIEVPADKAGGWRVEADFIEAIRGGPRPTRTDFESGARYMEFTEAVARSARLGRPVRLPLEPLPHGDGTGE
jgi:predicted dehydrogenase